MTMTMSREKTNFFILLLQWCLVSSVCFKVLTRILIIVSTIMEWRNLLK